MSDFTSGFWPIYISVLTLVSILGTWIFLKSQTTRRFAPGEKAALMEHTWDGDLQDLNNPLPRWWLGLFYGTMIFGLGYLALWPGLGNYAGLLGWTSRGEYQAEVKAAEAQFQPLYAKYMQEDIATVAADPDARAIGKHLFLTYCSQCHGSDATGAKGFPNLTDKDWLYGGDPDTIQATIANGRNAVMPAWGPILGAEKIKQVANYVLSLSGRKHDAALAAAGKAVFAENCAACHMPDGTGMKALGAPNLTDKVWLYGGSEATIIESITKGRNGVMPALSQTLGTTSNKEAKLHLLAAYVYGLGGGVAKAAEAAPAAPAAEAAAPASPQVAKIYFDTGKAEMSAEATTALQPIIDFAKANPDARIAISGFHDTTGGAAANAELAQNRAKAVRDALTAAGIAEDRIELRKPEVTTGEGGPAEARRVEARII
ncbi:MAG: cytochrome-c oxidase, cbb3-type subunit III [Hyphomicrobiaceae bacterium]